MLFINIFLVIFILIFFNRYSKNNKGKKIIKTSILLIVLLIITSYISLIISLTIVTIISSFVPIETDLFSMCIMLMLIGSIIEHYLMKYIYILHFNDSIVFSVVEQFIQWIVIYLTLYQALSNSFHNISEELFSINFKEITFILDGDLVILTILPVLLISGVNITFARLRG